MLFWAARPAITCRDILTSIYPVTPLMDTPLPRNPPARRERVVRIYPYISFFFYIWFAFGSKCTRLEEAESEANGVIVEQCSAGDHTTGAGAEQTPVVCPSVPRRAAMRSQTESINGPRRELVCHAVRLICHAQGKQP